MQVFFEGQRGNLLEREEVSINKKWLEWFAAFLLCFWRSKSASEKNQSIEKEVISTHVESVTGHAIPKKSNLFLKIWQSLDTFGKLAFNLIHFAFKWNQKTYYLTVKVRNS